MIERQGVLLLVRSLALFSHVRKQGILLVRCIVLATVSGFLFESSNPAEAQVVGDLREIQAVVVTRSGGICFVIENLKDPREALVMVWRADANPNTSPPILGTTAVDQGKLVFTPRFPFQKGTSYVVRVRPDSRSQPINSRLEIPADPAVKTKVTGVYPSADELPANTLKFYLQFSAPMQKGDIYRHVRLRKVGGEDVELPFLEIEQEFWSRDAKRLTLLLDPGRIKRGLKPREEMGPILVPGESYDLIISGDWPDSIGRCLGQDYRKRFVAVAEDHVQPDPATWKVTSPTIGSQGPLKVSFPDPLDYAMLLRAIRVIDADSNRVSGVTRVAGFEDRWTFKPDQVWKSGKYKLVISKDLEDNAGNSIERLFDVDLFDKTESPNSIPVVELGFEVTK